MDLQVLSQAQEGDSNRAMQEYYDYRAGLDGSVTGLSEADGVLLMELMEDSPAPPVDDDVDRLSHVIRSLEAEIMRGAAATVLKVDGESLTVPPSDDSCMIEEMLMVDLDGYGGPPMGYWPEVPAEGDWYLYTDGGEVGYEVRDQQCYCVDQSCVEQVYSPLWG